MKASFAIVLLVLLCSCSAINVTTVDGQRRTTVRVFVPAYPWQNSQQIVDRFALSAKTNAFTLGLKSSQAETGDTNFWAGVNGVVGAAIVAAVKAAKTP
jgi:hypothetical protein